MFSFAMLRARFRFHRLFAARALALLVVTSHLAAEPVWLVSNGFHSSLGMRVRDLPAWLTPTGTPPAQYLVIGWGDANWYRGQVTFGTFCSAVFWPTPSVLHVVPERGEIAQEFPHSDVLRFDLSPANLAKLRDGLERSFVLDAHGHLISAGDGFLPGSRFFFSRERFYFPKMCNYWVAERLRAAGLPITRAIAASGLVQQAARCGQREQFSGKPGDYF